jgi:hypothetical protein
VPKRFFRRVPEAWRIRWEWLTVGPNADRPDISLACLEQKPHSLATAELERVPPSGTGVVRAYFFLVAFLAPVLALGDLVAAFLVAFFAAAMSTLLVGHDQRDAKMRDNGTTLASRGTAPDITD